MEEEKKEEENEFVQKLRNEKQETENALDEENQAIRDEAVKQKAAFQKALQVIEENVGIMRMKMKLERTNRTNKRDGLKIWFENLVQETGSFLKGEIRQIFSQQQAKLEDLRRKVEEFAPQIKDFCEDEVAKIAYQANGKVSNKFLSSKDDFDLQKEKFSKDYDVTVATLENLHETINSRVGDTSENRRILFQEKLPSFIEEGLKDLVKVNLIKSCDSCLVPLMILSFDALVRLKMHRDDVLQKHWKIFELSKTN